MGERMQGKRLFCAFSLVIGLSAVLGHAAAANQGAIFESAKLGVAGQDQGFTLSANQWLGVRFTTTEPIEVSAIGGHVTELVPGNLFVAIFAVESSLPPSPPNIDDAIFVTTFVGPQDSGEVTIPANFHLPPGNWAIVFGSGAAGATGHGAMPGKDLDIGSPKYFSKEGSSWIDGGFGKARFFIRGKPAREAAPGKSRPARSVELA